MKNYVLGAKTTKNLETLLNSGKKESMVLVSVVKAFIKYTPIDFCVLPSGGYRTAEEQNEYFKKGVSKCDGYEKKSFHQSGLAVDLVPYVNGVPSWGTKETFYLAGAFMEYCEGRGLDITSGADWNRDGILSDGWDPCHFQIAEE